MNKIVELFGVDCCRPRIDLRRPLDFQRCPYTGGKCIKTRKSQSSVAIGTCTVSYQDSATIICPFRLLEKNQVFIDCLHLLTLHEPGNQIYRIPEVKIPGGNVDYFLVSARERKVVDFVGIELQTLDTTGTIWPERQRLLAAHGIKVMQKDVRNTRPFGMNWKMTAKTILVQMHHKARTFEALNKHLVLVVQDRLMAYMMKDFDFEDVSTHSPALGDSVHFHPYSLQHDGKGWNLSLGKRFSTDTDGIGKCLGLMLEPNVALHSLLETLETKLTDDNRLSIGGDWK